MIKGLLLPVGCTADFCGVDDGDATALAAPVRARDAAVGAINLEDDDDGIVGFDDVEGVKLPPVFASAAALILASDDAVGA